MTNFSQPVEHNSLTDPAFNVCPDDQPCLRENCLEATSPLKNKHWFQLVAISIPGKYASKIIFFVVVCGGYEKDFSTFFLGNLLDGQSKQERLHPM